jgi:hypothetical protein
LLLVLLFFLLFSNWGLDWSLLFFAFFLLFSNWGLDWVLLFFGLVFAFFICLKLFRSRLKAFHNATLCSKQGVCMVSLLLMLTNHVCILWCFCIATCGSLSRRLWQVKSKHHMF